MHKIDCYKNVLNLFPFLQEIDDVHTPLPIVQLPAGTCAFMEGENCTHVALVVHGSIRIVKISESGRSLTLFRVHEGESCVLLLSSVLAGIPLPATAIVEEDTEALMIPVEQFQAWMKRSASLQIFVYDRLTQRLATLMTLIEEIAFKRMDHRLVEHVLSKTCRDQLVLETTHEEIALELGTAREVVSRLLKEFEKENWITVTRGKITVINRPAMQATLMH